MKKIKIAIMAATLLIASAVNFGILTKNIGVNVAYACDPWAHGPIICPQGGPGCAPVYHTPVGCDPNDPDWECSW